MKFKGGVATDETERIRQSELTHDLVNLIQGTELHPNGSEGTTKGITIIVMMIIISIGGNYIEWKGNFVIEEVS